ncbi:hypothetical protein CBR_g84896 [Chara braunii]|uniref:Myb-like domain-containing protein n=1 Tax=Chara braunii TaxID=69332 RepID=A0A388KBA4_CHABU|nr:hypothetical protein CBR_g84896 [Chara braunii]|eukprot:GBG67233.1 hypothetical protein CBR_g84896 [Chara braunii]
MSVRADPVSPKRCPHAEYWDAKVRLECNAIAEEHYRHWARGLCPARWFLAVSSARSSQPSHEMNSSTTTLSTRRSPSTMDADRRDMDNAWTPHCGTSVPSGFDSDAANDYDGQACEDMEDGTGNGDGDDVDDDSGDGGGVPETDKASDSNGRNNGRRGKERYVWVTDHMTSEGYPQRIVEDCRKKWSSMLSKAKLILDKCENASGLPSYWDTDLEKRKDLQVPFAFEKLLWDAMQWKLNKLSMTCDQPLGSEDLPGAGEGTLPSGRSGSEKSGSEARGTNGSEGEAKMRRTPSGKTRMDDVGTGRSTLARAMEESTRSYGDGLDKAASTLAKATSDVGTTMAAKIGDVAEAIRGGNTVLEMLVSLSQAEHLTRWVRHTGIRAGTFPAPTHHTT